MSQTRKSKIEYVVRPTLNALQQPVWGKLSWKRQLAESRLPHEITSIVQSVLAACRLSRGEKAAVAEELLAHFSDGLDRGQSSPQLVEDFGDPAVAAPLIQSAKRRNRPMWKKSLQFSGYGIAGLIAAYVIVSIWFHLGKPTPSVDYVAQMNQPIAAVAESEKAWPIYRPMWTKYKFSEGGQFDIPEMWFHEPDPEDETAPTSQRLIRHGDEGWQAARQAFAQHADLLQAFREGARKPYFGVELQNDPKKYSDEDFAAIYPARSREDFDTLSANISGMDNETNQLIAESTIMVLLPQVQVLRKAARIFVVDTRLAVDENDSERALQNLETMLGLARHSAEGPVLICSLVGYAIAGITFDQIEEVLQQDPDFFNDEQLARLQTAVQSADIRGWLHFEGEHLVLEDVIQRTYTDDGDGDGRFTSQGLKFLIGFSGAGFSSGEENNVQRWSESLLGPASLFVAASRKEVTERANRLLDQLIEDADRPFWEANHFDLDAELEQDAYKYKYALLSLMLPAVQHVRVAMDRSVGRQEGVRGALALQRYHQQNGNWPKSWNEIPKPILSAVPIDQLNGEPLRFKIVDGRPLIYSVGNDRDDDGGQDLKWKSGLPLPGQTTGRAHFRPDPRPDEERTPDGDWIVWPQGERN
ncbi:MAG: hypothetical protein MK108_11590 [Mariniblastus sp.]|nr:hypothetical protein [Mariniblastus sp.]